MDVSKMSGGETAHSSTNKLQLSTASWPTSAACGAELAALSTRTLWASRVPVVSVCSCPSWGFEGKQAWQGVRSGGAGPSVYVWSRRLRAHDDLLTQELPSTACQKLIRGGRILFKKPLGQGCLAWGWKCKRSHSSSGSSTPKVSKQHQAGKSGPGPGPGWGGPATMPGPAAAGRSIHWSAPEPIFSQGSPSDGVCTIPPVCTLHGWGCLWKWLEASDLIIYCYNPFFRKWVSKFAKWETT